MIQIETYETNSYDGVTCSFPEPKMITFPGGEEHVNLLTYKTFDKVVIKASICNSSELMRLFMLKDVIDQHKAHVTLKLGYLPYARQDRRCTKGDAFSLKVFCELLNSRGFDEVQVLDPHSDVGPALIDNVKVIKQMDIISESKDLRALATSTIAVSPDAGSNKKVQDISMYSQTAFIRADKLRDLSTGEIKETIVYADKITQAVTIWDDICDGGRTFIELAKKLKALGAPEVNLYITHGIFSKGVQILVDNGIDNVFCTDSLEQEDHKNLTIIKQ